MAELAAKKSQRKLKKAKLEDILNNIFANFVCDMHSVLLKMQSTSQLGSDLTDILQRTMSEPILWRQLERLDTVQEIEDLVYLAFSQLLTTGSVMWKAEIDVEVLDYDGDFHDFDEDVYLALLDMQERQLPLTGEIGQLAQQIRQMPILESSLNSYIERLHCERSDKEYDEAEFSALPPGKKAYLEYLGLGPRLEDKVEQEVYITEALQRLEEDGAIVLNSAVTLLIEPQKT